MVNPHWGGLDRLGNFCSQIILLTYIRQNGTLPSPQRAWQCPTHVVPDLSCIFRATFRYLTPQLNYQIHILEWNRNPVNSYHLIDLRKQCQSEPTTSLGFQDFIYSETWVRPGTWKIRIPLMLAHHAKFLSATRLTKCKRTINININFRSN